MQSLGHRKFLFVYERYDIANASIMSLLHGVNFLYVRFPKLRIVLNFVPKIYIYRVSMSLSGFWLSHFVYLLY